MVVSLKLLLLLQSKLEDKTCVGGLCEYNMDMKAYRIYSNKMGRATESRNVTFIENRESALIGSTATNINGGGISTHRDSSKAENTDDNSITYNDEIDSALKELSNITSRNMDHPKNS